MADVDQGGLLASIGTDVTVAIICVSLVLLTGAAIGYTVWRRHCKSRRLGSEPSPSFQGCELQPQGLGAGAGAGGAGAVNHVRSPCGSPPPSPRDTVVPSERPYVPKSAAAMLATGAAAGCRVASAAAAGMRFAAHRPMSEEHERRAREVFVRADADGDGRLSREEVTAAVADLPQLWEMLEVNTGIERSRCQDIAARVALCKLDSTHDGSLTWPEFRALWTSVLNNPKNQLEFYHRAMFSAFDTDGNKTLDPEELAAFLEIFYKEGSIFSGDRRLPPKEDLVHLAMSRLDRNRDRRLSFRELEPLLTGHMQIA